MKIYVATDHAGYELKGVITKYLEAKNHEIVDCGAYELQ